MRRRLKNGEHPITDNEVKTIVEWVEAMAARINEQKDKVEQQYRIEKGLEEWPVDDILKYRKEHDGEFPKGVVLNYPEWIYDNVDKPIIPANIKRILDPSTRKGHKR